MNLRKTVLPLAILILTATFLAGVASAGEIRGKTSDSVGGALAGAEVTIENVATGASSLAISDATGAYSFTGLKAGLYRIIARATGFSEAVRNSSLATEADTAMVDFILSLGNLQSEVTVTASRSARDALVVPLRAESLGPETMATTNPASPGELLIEATGVTPVGSGQRTRTPSQRHG